MHLLVQLGTHLEATDMLGLTALHWAARYGHIDAVLALRDMGADLHITGKCSCLLVTCDSRNLIVLVVSDGNHGM